MNTVSNQTDPLGNPPAAPRPAVELRRVSQLDLDRIEEIQAASRPGATQWPRTAYLRYECWVAVVAGTVAGFVLYRDLGPGEGEILNLAVAPEFRRQGIGRALVRKILAEHPGEVYLEVRRSNTVARRLYESEGFQVVALRPDYYQNPVEDAIVMRFQSC